MAGVCALLMQQGHIDAALEEAIRFYLYLRPCESRRAKVGHFTFPQAGTNPGLQHYGLVIGPIDEGRPAKNQVFDDTVLFDSTPWLAELIAARIAGRPPQAAIFQTDAKALLRIWNAAVKTLRMPKSVQYQLRHGGPSEDALARRRTPLEIMQRGRWTCYASVNRYTKPGQLQRYLSEIPPDVRTYNQTCLAYLPDILAGRVSAPATPLP